MADVKKVDIEKMVKLGEEAEKTGFKSKEQGKCYCTHSKKGHGNVFPNNKGAFTCNKCKKDNIRLSKDVLNEQKIEEACQTFDNLFDVLKMNLNVEQEGDAKLLKRIAKMQYFVRNEALDVVKGIKRKSGKQQKKNDSESSWGKSRMV